MNSRKAQKKLDAYVEMRGDVAHRSRGSARIAKGAAQDFVAHAERLVDGTDARVNAEIAEACGKPLF